MAIEFLYMNDHPLPHSTPTLLPRSEIGRNDACPCGSGKKYKKCCLLKDFHAEQEQQKKDDLEWIAWFKADCEVGRQNLIAIGENPPL